MVKEPIPGRIWGNNQGQIIRYTVSPCCYVSIYSAHLVFLGRRQISSHYLIPWYSVRSLYHWALNPYLDKQRRHLPEGLDLVHSQPHQEEKSRHIGGHKHVEDHLVVVWHGACTHGPAQASSALLENRDANQVNCYFHEYSQAKKSVRSIAITLLPFFPTYFGVILSAPGISCTRDFSPC